MRAARAVSLLLPLALWPPTHLRAQDAEKEIRQLEQAWAVASEHNDTATFNRLRTRESDSVLDGDAGASKPRSMLAQAGAIEQVEHFVTAFDAFLNVGNERFVLFVVRREEGANVTGSADVLTAQMNASRHLPYSHAAWSDAAFAAAHAGTPTARTPHGNRRRARMPKL